MMTALSGQASVNAALDGVLRVVYLAGSGHTGSTLLALLMDAHPAVASVGEIAIKPKIRYTGGSHRQKCSCGALVGECEFWRRIFEGVRACGFDMDSQSWTNDYRITHPLLHRLLTRDSSHALLRSLRHMVERHLPMYQQRIRHIDRVNVAFVRSVLQTTGASVFFDTSKGPMRLARLREIPEFEVSVVTLVRDVRAYVASAKRRGKTVKDAAQTWKADQLHIRRAMVGLPSERTLLVRYEDLCRRPDTTIRQLCGLCGVASFEPPRRVFSYEHHVLGNNMRMAGPIEVRFDERWRHELSPSEQAEAVRIAGGLLEEFGYLP